MRAISATMSSDFRLLEERLLKPQEVAKILGISVATLRRLVDDGRICYVNISRGLRNKRLAFRESHVLDFIRWQERRGREPTLLRRKRGWHVKGEHYPLERVKLDDVSGG